MTPKIPNTKTTDFSLLDPNGIKKASLISPHKNLFTNYDETKEQILKYHCAKDLILVETTTSNPLAIFNLITAPNTLILYDELLDHTLITNINTIKAKSQPYIHNDIEQLHEILETQSYTTAYIITAFVFPIDGDSPNIEELAQLAQNYQAKIIIDQTHAIGIFDTSETGRTQDNTYHPSIFATYINYQVVANIPVAALITTNSLSTHISIPTKPIDQKLLTNLNFTYQFLEKETENNRKLKENIVTFNQCKNMNGLKPLFVHSKSAIQSAIIPGKSKVYEVASKLQQQGFKVNPITAPQVPEHQERLQIHLRHDHTSEDITRLMNTLMLAVFLP